jgi:uncharacterized protein (TIGR00375 family)
MKFVADLHLHSHYSRATSKNLNLEHLFKWAQLKGVQVVGTGDISHPGWLQEMKDKLVPAEEGLFRLKDESAAQMENELPPACRAPVRFMLAGEISSIYKKKDKVRKVHNVIFASTLQAVEKIQAELEKIGNIRSDGRPILGLDSRDLLEIILTIDSQNYLIPAHIWTPWFSLLGSKSGFDSVEECFADLTPHIFALETGLSSDPPMNWRVSNLDGYTLVSNSDAHSPQKLAREGNLFDTDRTYRAIFEALKTGEPASFLGTIEFFPEEGKYHYDGHRKCNIRWEPRITLAHNGLCPVCGKPVTVGVTHRVEMLADREEGERPARTHSFHSLIPLPEILAEVHNVGPNSKRVRQNYESLLSQLGPELAILQDVALDEIERAGGSLLAEGIRRMRAGELSIAAGYDGEYGVIKLFKPEERDTLGGQLSLFGLPAGAGRTRSTGRPAPIPKPDQPQLFSQPAPIIAETSGQPAYGPTGILSALNPEQQQAVLCTDAPLIIVAGPGTGKTRTLTHRIAYLIAEQGIKPEHILAITFTNKAASEMVQRLAQLLEPELAGRLTVKTFHAFGAQILRAEAETLALHPRFAICSEADRQALLKQIQPDLSAGALNQLLDQISGAKNDLLTPETSHLSERFDPQFIEIYERYQALLRQNHLADFDDLILLPVRLFESSPEILARYRQRYCWLSVDEYQDINLAQYRLLRLLTGPETNLCAIGDPNQAIYGFRGARREYFLRFQQDFPGAQSMHLNQNYRSTQLILDASGQVISQSAEQRPFNLWSEVVDPTKLQVYLAPTDKAEAEYVVHQIEQMIGGTSYFSLDSGRVDDDHLSSRTFADFAVLYRLGALSQPLSEAFDRSGIPYQTVGQTPLTGYKEIKTILACLWSLHHPDSSFYLEQVMSRKQAQTLAPVLTGLSGPDSPQSVSVLIESIQQLLLEQASFRLDEKGNDRVRQLVRRAAPFDNNLLAFLESTVLHQETDLYDPRADRVTLMTLHASKGLEFPVVFIVGCEDDLIPYRREDKPADLEEERRLFYVGMTRARQKLILTHAKSRFLFGRRLENRPSPFLNDIENTLKEFERMASRRSKEKEDPAQQLPLF